MPRRIIVVAVLVMVGAAAFGIPGIKSLSAGGFQDPTAESARAAELLSAKFGRGDLQMILWSRLRRRAKLRRPRRRHRYR